MSTAAEIYAVYAVDVLRSMAMLADASPVTFFRAASLLQYFVAENGGRLQPKHYLEDGILVWAAAALYAVAKVDAPRINLSTLVALIDVVKKKRFLQRGAASTVVKMFETSKLVLDELRRNVATCEWALLEAAGFTTTCEVPHNFAFVIVRSLLRTAAPQSEDDKGGDEHEQSVSAEVGRAPADGGEEATAAPGDERRRPGSPSPTASTVASDVDRVEREWLNAALGLCNDSSRSRMLTTEIEASVVAAAAVFVAAERVADVAGVLAQCPSWPALALAAGQEADYDRAVAELQRVIAMPSPVALLQDLINPPQAKPASPKLDSVPPVHPPGGPHHHVLPPPPMPPAYPGGPFHPPPPHASVGPPPPWGAPPMGRIPPSSSGFGWMPPPPQAPPAVPVFKELKSAVAATGRFTDKKKDAKRSRSKSKEKSRKKSKDKHKDKKDKTKDKDKEKKS